MRRSKHHTEAIVDRFLTAALDEDRAPRWAPRCCVPEAMRSSRPDPDGWVRWRPVASTVTRDNLDLLQSMAGARLPPAFVALLERGHFVDLDLGLGLELTPHCPDSWLLGFADLRARLAALPGRPTDRGLFPFATNAYARQSFICFDLSRRAADGDCPVVLCERADDPRKTRQRLLFSSSSAMFERLTFLLEERPVVDSVSDGPGNLCAELTALTTAYLEEALEIPHQPSRVRDLDTYTLAAANMNRERRAHPRPQPQRRPAVPTERPLRAPAPALH